MTFTEIISKQREVYLKQLLIFYSAKNGGAQEVLLGLSSESKRLLLNLYKADYAKPENGKLIIEELIPDTYASYQTVYFLYDNFELELNPFYWDRCEVAIYPLPTDILFLENWVKKWLDEEERLKKTNEGLDGTIHSVTFPKQRDETLTFSIDLGSVPINALSELIDEIKINGGQKVVISSSDLNN